MSKPGPVLRLNSEDLESLAPKQNNDSENAFDTFTPINLTYSNETNDTNVTAV